MDGQKEKFKAAVSQLNGNPANMLKSTVRNLEFKEKQMLAKNKFLQSKSNFLETLLREIVTTNNFDLKRLPRELLEQDKYNLLEDLKRGLLESRPQQSDPRKKSKSERTLYQEPLNTKSTFQSTKIAEPYRNVSTSVGNPAQTNVQSTPGQQYLGFDLRNLKKSTNGQVKDSSRAIEDRINAIGQNRFARPRF